jgi:hypothetical protein
MQDILTYGNHLQFIGGKMSLDSVKVGIIEVLKEIGAASGYGGQPLDVTTCPTKDLAWFDSLIWPVSLVMLSDKFGVGIPNDANIYKSDDGKSLSIGEAADRLLTIINGKEA